MIEFRVENLEQIIKAMTPTVVQQATLRTVNELTRKARVLQSKEIRKEYAGVKAGEIKKLTKVVRASRNQKKPTGAISQTGRRIPVGKLKHTKLKRGYSVMVRKGGRFKAKKAFGALVNQQNDSSHAGIFIRKGKKRLPIKELFGPSIPQMAEGQTDDIYGFVEKEGPEIMVRNLDFYFKKSEGLL
jgi:hypothetical protein